MTYTHCIFSSVVFPRGLPGVFAECSRRGQGHACVVMMLILPVAVMLKQPLSKRVCLTLMRLLQDN